MVPEQEDEVVEGLDFSSREAAEASMSNYIKENFGEFLGDNVSLLDEPDGIEKLRQAYEKDIEEAGKNLFDNINQLVELLNKL